MSGLLMLPEGLRKIHLQGPVLHPTAEGHITRMLLSALTDIYTDVSCSQSTPMKGLPQRDEDELTRTAETYYRNQFEADVLVSVGSSAELLKRTENGVGSVSLSLDHNTDSLDKVFSTIFSGTNTLGQKNSWAEWWIPVYNRIKDQVKAEDCKLPGIALPKSFNSVLADSQLNYPTPEVLAKAVTDLHKQVPNEHYIIYLPEGQGQFFQEFIDHLGELKDLKIDILVNWLSLPQRILLDKYSDATADFGAIVPYSREGKNEQGTMTAMIAAGLNDWMFANQNNPELLARAEAAETFKRIGFICDHTPAEAMGEKIDVIRDFYLTLLETREKIGIEFMNRKFEETCCLDMAFIFQPSLLSQEKFDRLQASTAKKIFVALESFEEVGQWTKSLIKICDEIVFRSPLQAEAYKAAGLVCPVVHINPCVRDIVKLETDKVIPRIGCLDIDFGESFDLAPYLQNDALLCLNAPLPASNIPALTWYNPGLQRGPGQLIHICEEYIDFSRKPKVFNTPLAIALSEGKKIVNQLIHGCLAYQDLRKAMGTSSMKSMLKEILK